MSNQPKESTALRFIRCSIGNEDYGLDMSWVKSIQRTDHLLTDPKRNANDTSLVGKLMDAGEEVPVFSLASLLGYSLSDVEDDSQQRIIVLDTLTNDNGCGDKPWALLVDRVSQVIPVSRGQFDQVPAVITGPATTYFNGVIKLENRLVLSLEPRQLHPNFDQARMKQGKSISETLLKTQESPQLSPNSFQPSTSAPQLLEASPDNEAAPNVRLNANEFQSQHSDLQTSEDNSGLKHSVQNSKIVHHAPNSKTNHIIIFSTRRPELNRTRYIYGLSIVQIPEILRPLPLTAVPGAPDYVLGIVNWRNQTVPIIDLDTRLGLEFKANSFKNTQSRLIIVQGINQDTFVGFPVRPGPRVLSLPIAHKRAIPDNSLDKTMVRGVIEIDNETLIFPNVQRILGVSA